MTIQEDAKTVLNFIYSKYVEENKLIGANELLSMSMEGKRINQAIKYLRDIGYIEIVLLLGNIDGLQNFILRKITPAGINKAESEL